MSSQLLYQVFRVKGYSLTKTEVEEHRVLLHVQPQPHRVCCSACRSRNVVRRGEKTRWFRNLPVAANARGSSPRCRESSAVIAG